MHTISLLPPARERKGTDIQIGKDTLSLVQNFTKDYERVVVLFDQGILPIATLVTNSIPNCVPVMVQSGDSSKSLTEVDRIVSAMLEAGCSRKTLLICIGGGMMSDLGGFIASIFMRGISSIFVPTTLLGMVDAAIGGKNAVNVGAKKNMIGTIAHPVAVIIDTDLLQKLPVAQLSEGLAEVIKIAAIVDSPFFEWLEEHMSGLMKREAVLLEECVLRAVQAKVNIVQNDEHDRNERLLLNFGHTVGHAVEALSLYDVSHGFAVSIGISAEMKLAQCSDQARIEALLVQAGLPLEIPSALSREALWQAMLSDKKNEKGLVKIAVPKKLGEGVVLTLTKEKFLTLFA